MDFIVGNQHWKISIFLKLDFSPVFIMTALRNNSKRQSDKRSLLIISGILAAVGLGLFSYLMFYTAPLEVMERVKVIAITDSGCIAETMDGFAVNIGQCSAQEGSYVVAPVDQKVKERAAAMNPTS